jgi:hypothetical protein
MKRGHVTGRKREKPMTAREMRQLKTLTQAVWAQIHETQRRGTHGPAHPPRA